MTDLGLKSDMAGLFYAILLHCIPRQDLHRTPEPSPERDLFQVLANCALDLSYSSDLHHANLCIVQHVSLSASCDVVHATIYRNDAGRTGNEMFESRRNQSFSSTVARYNGLAVAASTAHQNIPPSDSSVEEIPYGCVFCIGLICSIATIVTQDLAYQPSTDVPCKIQP